MAREVKIEVSQPVQSVEIAVDGRGQQGPAGADGAAGADGPAGEGVPTGGTTGQALIKSSGADYATEWGDAGQTFDQDLDTTDSPQFEGLTVSSGGMQSYGTSAFEAGLESAGDLTVTSGGVAQVYSSISNPGVDSESLKISVSDDGDATIATVDEGAGTAGDLVLAAAGGSTSLQITDSSTTAVQVIGGGLGIPAYKQLSFGESKYAITRTTSSMQHKSWTLPFVWLSSAGELMRLDNASGNLGIGTASPAAKLDVDGTVKSTVYTVATLPVAATTAGQRSFVSDATASHAAGIGATVTGGGANFVPVYSDGTNWIIG